MYLDECLNYLQTCYAATAFYLPQSGRKVPRPASCQILIANANPPEDEAVRGHSSALYVIIQAAYYWSSSDAMCCVAS